ncbi:MAG: DUF58 domain-containing protein [Anaerolineaceae bacterium]|nr:DUF58 domain-containing protein [Anaerolineaceae bacterium]
MNNKTLTVSLLVAGLFLAALMARSGDLAWLALLFLAYLGVGIFQYPARELVRLEAERHVSRTNGGDASMIEVRVRVRNLGANLVRVALCDEPGEGLVVSAGALEWEGPLRAGDEAQLIYSFREKRGSYVWKTVHARVSDPLGVVETEYLLPAPGEIDVLPEQPAMRRLPLRPRSTLHAPGSIPARVGGSGTDFWGVREYHPGDPLRWLDWRLTARHPRKFFTKEFEQEEIADVGLIVDARGKTNLSIVDPISGEEDSLFEHTASAAGALAEAFLHQGHRVSMLVFGCEAAPVFAGYGKVQLNKIMRCLANTRVGGGGIHDFSDYLPLRMFSSRALLIVISPLVRSDRSFFLRLRAAGHQGLLISPDPFDFMGGDPAQVKQPADGAAYRDWRRRPETGLAVRAAHLERNLLLRDISQMQVGVIDWRVSEPLYPLVRAALKPEHLRRGGLQSRKEPE